MFRSAAAVIGSYLLSIVLVLSSDLLLTRVFPGDFVRGRIPSDRALMTSTALFIVVSILCAWVCARFSPSRAARHVLWFFVIGEVLGVATTIPNWNQGWPHWYWISWLLSWPVDCYVGLLLGGKKEERVAAVGR